MQFFPIYICVPLRRVHPRYSQLKKNAQYSKRNSLDINHKEEDLATIRLIDEHLDRFFEDDEIKVFHDLDEDETRNHIDVYWISPKTDDMLYSIIMTCGISRHPMNVPEGKEEYKYVELAMILPLDWELDNIENRPDIEKWPFIHLKSIGKIPHDNNTWLGFGHTISWSPDRDEKFPGTELNSSIILKSITLPKSFTKIQDKEREIKILTVIPLYPEELEFKTKNNSSKLIEKFNEFNIDEELDINRINTCK